MEDWDQETLEKVVESKRTEYNQNKPTEIVRFLISWSLSAVQCSIVFLGHDLYGMYRKSYLIILFLFWVLRKCAYIVNIVRISMLEKTYVLQSKH